MNADSQSSSGDHLLDVLLTLLNTKAMTAETLERYIREHPELLQPVTQTLLSVLAEAQETSEGRTQVITLARILVRLQTESALAVFSSESNRARRQFARQRREARLRAARDEFLSWRKREQRDAPNANRDKSLPSLSKVISDIRSISNAERAHVYGRDLLNAQTASDSIPAYLFRGESGSYPSTHSSLGRLLSDPGVSSNAIEDIVRISDFLVAAFEDRWSLTARQSLGFLQHYGYPTDLIDVTSNVLVAASFASSLRVGDVGAICIIPTDNLIARGSLIDLRHHPLAQRPRRQSASAVHLPEFPDLKAPAAIEALHLTWIRFQLTEIDAVRFIPMFELLDARSDQVAGLIWLMISDYGKFSDAAAALLARRIDPSPVFGITGSDGKIVMVSEDDVASENSISDDDFRHSHYEEWSDAFKAREPLPLPKELESSLLTGSPEPGSILQLLTFRAIRKGERKK